MNDFKIAKFVDNSFEIDVRADINNETVTIIKKFKWKQKVIARKNGSVQNDEKDFWFFKVSDNFKRDFT